MGHYKLRDYLSSITWAKHYNLSIKRNHFYCVMPFTICANLLTNPNDIKKHFNKPNQHI